MTPTILPNTLAEAGALAIQASLSSSYGADLPPIFVSRGRNNVQPRPFPNVIVYMDNVEYPEEFNTRIESGSVVVVQQLGRCAFNIEIEQYATDTPADDMLGNYVFGPFNNPKQLLESVSSGSLFIYSFGRPQVFDQLNTEDNTWIQKYSVSIFATLTT